MSTQAEKDVLQKIVEGMDISDEELEFQNAVDVNQGDSGEASKKEEASQKEESTGTLEMEVTEEKDGVEGSSKNKETETSSEKLGHTVESDEGTIQTIELPKHKPTIKVRNDIIDEIFETEANLTLENTRSTRKKSNESEEASKNMEEETIENIQTLLDTGSELQKAVSRKKSKEDSGKSETDEVNEPGVFISINSKEDSERFLAEEDGIQNPLESSGPTKPTNTAAIAQDIPQVMLDQLDLKKFPNLKINEKGTTQSTPRAKPDLKKNNTNLLEAIKKRMELRKEKQKESKINEDGSESEEEEEEKEKQVGDTPRRGRGRPRKYPPTTPGTEVKATPKSKVETKSKTTEGLQSSKKAPPVKSKPEIKIETDDDDEEEEEEEEEDGFPIIARPRSARKIKLTDKFKSFVDQEKTIKKILSEREDRIDERPRKTEYKTTNMKPAVQREMPERLADGKFKPRVVSITPIVKSATKKSDTPAAKKSETPAAKKSEIQIKLKRKNTEISEEDDVIELPDSEERGGRKLRNRQKVAKKMATGKKGSHRKELISESELSDDYEAVDDEDRDPDFDHGDIGSDVSEGLFELETTLERSTTNTRTVVDLMNDVFNLMPTWNVHILPHTNNFCMAQIIRGVNGVPMLKKCIEMDHDFNVKVYVHQIHYKKYDGVYDSEEHLIELLQLVDAM